MKLLDWLQRKRSKPSFVYPDLGYAEIHGGLDPAYTEREVLRTFAREAQPFPASGVAAPFPLSRKALQAYMWSRPRYSPEGRVGKFHLFASNTPRRAICSYEPKRQSITVSDGLAFDEARKFGSHDEFCSHCVNKALELDLI